MVGGRNENFLLEAEGDSQRQGWIIFLVFSLVFLKEQGQRQLRVVLVPFGAIHQSACLPAYLPNYHLFI